MGRNLAVQEGLSVFGVPGVVLPAKRLEMAKLFARWARQLEVSAFIMTSDRRGCAFPRPRLPKLSQRKAALN